ATKLEEISYLAVNDGYLALEYNSKYEYELIASNGISYYVSESQIIREEGSNIIKIFNDNMYRDFEADKAYTVKVRIIALDENILNSNISKLEISIQIPKNTMNPLWTLDELSTNKYNLANTKLTWEDLDKGNGYLVRLNGVAKNHDTNEYLVQDFEKGEYTFEVAIKGDNEKQNGVYLLTSKYSDSKTFYVLGETTVAVKNGQITWEAVENATKYYIYLNDKQTKYETKNTYLDESVIGEKIPVGTYTVSVQAVSETENYFQGKTADFVDKDKNKIQVIKLKSPKDLVLDKGVLKYTDALPSQNFGFISVPTSSETPFKYNVNINISDLASSNTNIINQILTYKFESQNGSVYHADVEAVNYVDISAYASLLKNFVSGSDAEFLEDYLQKVYGWPNYTRLFDEYAKHIPAGEYNMSVRQKGYDKDYYLTSDFGTERTVYIPYAPKINVTFDNGIYTLNISKVVIPEHITTEPIIYEVYGAYEEDGIRKYTLLQSSTNRQLNLTELVNNGTINDKFTDIFAFVKGNDTNILNGKTSNTIEVKVLTEVDASIQEGVVVWKSQTYASGFRISYVNSNTEEYSELVIDDISWLAEELQEGITYKDVKIQALGTENKQVTTLVISGPETEIGTITKLNSVNWYIENG
ncbi:MAG: hypothetical protein IKA31_02680, partial [Clostridia bacterium]|nr:hypothetical protein [Clostridia bacterium]